MNGEEPGTFLYLARAEVEALLPAPLDCADAIESAFRALASGGAVSVPKNGFDITPSTFFHAMPARYDDRGVIGVKWIGTALNAERVLPHISAIIVLNDIETAIVKAIMDGTAVTAIRPAAVGLAAARKLARADSSRISFYPCGVQALANLEAFSTSFPIREVTCLSRRTATAEAFAAEARRRGFRATVVSDPRHAVEHQDIIVSSAPRAGDLARIFDPAWLSPGAFVSGVDLARAWQCRDLRQVDLLATDNHAQSREAAAAGIIAWDGEYDADLSELASGTHPGRTSPNQRAFFLHPGLGLGDVAIASRVFELAVERKAGTRLPR